MSIKSHDNNFNILRLVFAFLVIVSHGPELIDGNRSRELLTVVFGTYSFGDFAVNSFFILSGYLITASWLSSPYFLTYIKKRALRILPGFLVASLVSLVIFGPLGAPAFWSEFHAVRFFSRLPFLMFDLDGFWGNKYELVNGALWTIHYEFFCYLLIALLGILGVLNRPRLVFCLFWAALALYVLQFVMDPTIQANTEGFERALWTRLGYYVRFVCVFLSGSALYFLRGRIVANRKTVATAVVAFTIMMFIPVTAPIAMTVPWAFLLYVIGRRRSWISRMVGSTDLSYGIYLYAWPIEQLIIQRVTENVWAVVLLTTLGSIMIATLSWHFIERPALRYKTKLRDPDGAVHSHSKLDGSNLEMEFKTPSKPE